ncbi:MAG: hypothetical protein AAB879_02030 [Patescibacteria group bacterium]
MKNVKSSHLGIGFVAGSILVVAAALFLQSPEGKRRSKELMRKSHKLHTHIMKELRSRGDITKQKYNEVVDQVMAYYEKSREVTKNELPEIRRFLLTKWKDIEKEMRSARS